MVWYRTDGFSVIVAAVDGAGTDDPMAVAAQVPGRAPGERGRRRAASALALVRRAVGLAHGVRRRWSCRWNQLPLAQVPPPSERSRRVQPVLPFRPVVATAVRASPGVHRVGAGAMSAAPVAIDARAATRRRRGSDGPADMPGGSQPPLTHVPPPIAANGSGVVQLFGGGGGSRSRAVGPTRWVAGAALRSAAAMSGPAAAQAASRPDR